MCHRSVKKYSLCCLLFAVSVLFCSSPYPVASASPAQEASDPPSKLEEQVKEWVSVLAKQKLFSEWDGADPQIQALGPGTHGWLVLFSKDGRHIGYMVVHAVTDGSFRMGEYGLGPLTLFSQQQLKRSLIKNGLRSPDSTEPITAVQHYMHPFAAAWEVTITGEKYWFDGKTAELLPVDESTWAELCSTFKDLPSSNVRVTSKVSELRLNRSFDAYERLPWLTKEAPFTNKEASKIRERLNNKQHLRYVAEPFGELMLYAAPVIGYQRWSNGRFDLALDMEGTRFIPFEVLTQYGLFYR